MDNLPMRQRVEEYIVDLQNKIVSSFEKLDCNAPHFKRDEWVRDQQGGRGLSCVFAVPLSDDLDASPPDTILEKAGVNISVLHGSLPHAAQKQMKSDHSNVPYDPDSPRDLPFFATGLSLVIHPRNPHAPTVHANLRYFEITEPVENTKEGEVGEVVAWWFGGGCDLTPSYLYEEDIIHFHRTLKDACDPHGTSLYPTFKWWCDEYFYIPHRQEARGVGGILFNDLSDEPHKRIPDDIPRPRSPDEIFAFIKSVGDAFLPSYLPILEQLCKIPYDSEQRRWQLLRRGRYVEFNLVYDRGTKFGFAAPGARVESILMSLPEMARWEYMSEMGDDESSEEGRMLKVLKSPKAWV
ncbi:Coproporphyrinogen oxidase [Panus rudis PR-1116 ss-1]|nr:Coproporphyrinogen oxidase [Panus rudis PR-1116 ss-1]